LRFAPDGALTRLAVAPGWPLGARSCAAAGKTPWDRVEESWDSANASRNVMTDAYNGELLNEYISTPSVSLLWNVVSVTVCCTSPAGTGIDGQGRACDADAVAGNARAAAASTAIGCGVLYLMSSATGRETVCDELPPWMVD
jgi:hypothetical protein